MQFSKTSILFLGLWAFMHMSCNNIKPEGPIVYTGTWICNSPNSVTSTYDTLLLNEDGTFSRSEKIIFHTMDTMPHEMLHWGKFEIIDDSIRCSIDSAKTCRTCDRYDLAHTVIRIRRLRFQNVTNDSIATVPFFWEQFADTLFGYRRDK